MSDSEAGPSGVKRPRLGKKTFQRRVPLTQEELERYLLDSDDDIGDPDFEESDDESGSSSDSDDPELDLSVLDDNSPCIVDPNLDLAKLVTTKSPTPQAKKHGSESGRCSHMGHSGR